MSRRPWRRTRSIVEVDGQRFRVDELLATVTPAEERILSDWTGLSLGALRFADPDSPDLLAAIAQVAAGRRHPDLAPSDLVTLDAPGHGLRGASFHPKAG